MIQFQEKFAKKIFLYYLKIFDRMSLRKQIHFIERLYLITRDPDLLEFLKKNRKEIHGYIFKKHQLPHIKTELIKESGLKNYRFNITCLQLYQNTFRKNLTRTFLKTHSLKKMLEIDRKVMTDPDKLIKLSTPFINFHYGLWLYLLHAPEKLQNRYLLDLVKSAARKKNARFSSLCYLLSHCIINGTYFYGRKIPAAELAPYLNMLKLLEKFIAGHSRVILLDEKIEFLLCCRLLEYKTKLEKPILRLAHRCLNAKGNFINNLQKNGPVSPLNYEHTNTLYLMIKFMDEHQLKPETVK
jgi:hypothetical protein